MTNSKPLSGISVVEIGHSVAAPAAGAILAQLGASVLKIEPPEGDAARGWGPPFWNGDSPTFLAYNRDKSAASVDLRDPQARGALRDYIMEEADVVLQNLRAGVVARYGLDAATLRRDKPSLIYCNIHAFGHSGPMSGKPGYDPLMQAFCGIMSVTGEEGQAPIRVGPSIIDVGSALWAVIGIVSALFDRTARGEGGVIDTSLFETAIAWMNMHVADYSASGNPPRKQGSGAAQIVPYQTFDTADGVLMVAAGNDRLFRALCEAIGHPEYADEPRFMENRGRVEHREALIPMIAAEMALRSNAAWQQALDARGVPNAPVQDLPALMRCPQFAASGILQEPPGEGALPAIGLPLCFDHIRPSFDRLAPARGEHDGMLGSTGKSER